MIIIKYFYKDINSTLIDRLHSSIMVFSFKSNEYRGYFNNNDVIRHTLTMEDGTQHERFCVYNKKMDSYVYVASNYDELNNVMIPTKKMMKTGEHISCTTFEMFIMNHYLELGCLEFQYRLPDELYGECYVRRDGKWHPVV